MGELGLIGVTLPEEYGWDFVVLARYPSRAVFIDMMTSDEYVKSANPHRVDGVIEHVILATRETYSKFKSA